METFISWIVKADGFGRQNPSRVRWQVMHNEIVRMFDLAGRVVFTRQITGNGFTLNGSINVSRLSPGSYFMEISSSKTRYVREFAVARKH